MRLEYFQMIDRIETLDLGEGRIVCRAVVPERSTIFEGHFPGQPLLPGVLMVETMAQSAGYLVLAKNGFSRMPLLAKIEQAKLRTFVEPRSALTVECELLHEGSGFAVTKGQIRHDGQRVADAEIRFRTMPFPSDDLRALLIETARGVGMDADALPVEAAVGA